MSFINYWCTFIIIIINSGSTEHNSVGPANASHVNCKQNVVLFLLQVGSQKVTALSTLFMKQFLSRELTVLLCY